MKSFQTVMYYPSWQKDAFDKVRYELIDRINYAFAIPTEDGDIRPLDNPETAKRLIREGKEHGTKIVISVGGWSYGGKPLESTFRKATETPEKVRHLAASILSVVKEYGFDGADIDWEYPRRHDDGDKANEYLYELLAEALHKKNKLLTTAVFSGQSASENDTDPLGNGVADIVYGLTDRALSLLDYVHIMAYDGGNGPHHSSYEFAVRCSKFWRDIRGIPAEKLLLGVPFYGRPGWASYEKIVAADPTAAHRDMTEINGTTSYYNGLETMRKKALYAREELGGIMAWEISEDSPDPALSLLCAIADVGGKRKK